MYSLLFCRTGAKSSRICVRGICNYVCNNYFTGLLCTVYDGADRGLKLLLMIHGIFSITCFVMPVLGVFSADMPGGYWISVALLEFWCIYFLPVGGLTHLYIAKQKD